MGHHRLWKNVGMNEHIFKPAEPHSPWDACLLLRFLRHCCVCVHEIAYIVIDFSFIVCNMYTFEG